MAKIRDLPLLERPREKAYRYGIKSLSSHELLAIILGTGSKNKSALDVGYELISIYKSLNNLSRLSLENLTKIKGISKAKAIKLMASFEIANRLITISPDTKINEQNAIDLIIKKYELILKNLPQEEMHLICLNKQRKILKETRLYIGTEKHAAIAIEEIITEVLLVRAKNFILIHNHPNGSNKPSDYDLLFTNELMMKCRNFKIKLLDHIIVSSSGHYCILGENN